MRGTESRLLETRDRFEQWRGRHGGRGIRIPDELWDNAVAAARVAGIDETARALGLDLDRLARRVTEAERGRAGTMESMSPQFVELELAPAAPASKTVLELVAPSGHRMRIDVTGGTNIDVIALARALWSSEP